MIRITSKAKIKIFEIFSSLNRPLCWQLPLKKFHKPLILVYIRALPKLHFFPNFCPLRNVEEEVGEKLVVVCATQFSISRIFSARDCSVLEKPSKDCSTNNKAAAAAQ